MTWQFNAVFIHQGGNMGFVHQQGILDNTTSAHADGDVIMAAAIVGHAYTRLSKNLNCAFETEAPLVVPPQRVEDSKDIRELEAVVGAINLALQNAGGNFGKPGGRLAQAGITPTYGDDGNGNVNVRIIGGSGDYPLDSPLRRNPPAPATTAALDLLKLALGQLTPKGGTQLAPLGYQGPGAYTGFVDGRSDGQSNLFCTYRHVIPNDPTSRRWIPSVPVDGVAVGTAPGQKIWGMLGTRADQAKLAAQGMYFQDEDKSHPPVVLDEHALVGYTHGMIQAIYNVKFFETAQPGKPAGTPYEIAIGTVAGPHPSRTTKLASCICCAVFMEATGFPASSTHLGRAECWAPLYPENAGGGAPDMSTAQNKSRAKANSTWAAYCATIISAGMPLIERNLKDDEHRRSFASLKVYAQGRQPIDFANLILDAVTLCQNETTRLGRTLIQTR
jgi:hypothetical protein